MVDVIGIAGLVAVAEHSGATFDLHSGGIRVGNPAMIPQDIAMLLRRHRDQLEEYLRARKQETEHPHVRSASHGITFDIIRDDDSARHILRELSHANPGRVSVDFETAPGNIHRGECLRLTRHGIARETEHSDTRGGLDPLTAEIRLVQICADGRHAYVFDIRHLSFDVMLPLWGMPLVFHNAQFEMSFLSVRGIHPRHFECTMQAAGIMLGVHRRSLEAAAREYLGWTPDKTLRAHDWSLAQLDDAQLEYAAMDAVATFRLWERLSEEVERSGRSRAYKLQRDAIPAAVEMQVSGIGVDVGRLDDIIRSWEDRLHQMKCDWSSTFGSNSPGTPSAVRTWLSSILDARQLEEWPKTGVTGALSTKAGDLSRASDMPGVRMLLEIRHLEKLLSVFGQKLRNKRNIATRRIHPNYIVAGTRSGRWTCNDPNLQQMPSERRAPGFRGVFCADAGYTLLGADYSQMELRAAAEISCDEGLRQIYRDGLDLHRMMAAEMTGKPPGDVTPEERSRAKPVNFGSIYGMGARGLVATAWNSYGVVMSIDDAQMALNSFFRKFAGLKRWMHRNAEICNAKRAIAIGLGRVFENAWSDTGIRYTQCCNLPIQGACADVMMLAVTRMQRSFREHNTDARLIAQVHDEIIVEAASGSIAASADIMSQAMTFAFLEMFPGAPTMDLVNIKTGNSWADLK